MAGRSRTRRCDSRTLRFTYGPEHQRIRQTVELTSSAPSHTEAGTREEGVGYQERETFDAFLQLPAPQRKVVREVIMTFAQAHAARKG